MDKETQDWLVPSILTVVAFLFGQTGIFTKAFNFFFAKKESEEQKVQSEIDELKLENIQLRKTVLELQNAMAQLRQDLALATEKIKYLGAYFDKLNPEGDSFINKILEKAEQEKH